MDAYSSHVLPAKAEKAYMGECINIMTQALQIADGSLPPGLTIQNMYTELQRGSKNEVMVVRNSTAYPQCSKRRPSGQGSACDWSARQTAGDWGAGRGDGPQDSHPPNLTTRQRQGKLFEELDPGRLNLWPLELTEDAYWLLAEYHNVFSLEPAELGCTHSTEHMIRVMDDTSFKEQFRKIPPSLVEEVWNHLWEMLESGAIQPSQST